MSHFELDTEVFCECCRHYVDEWEMANSNVCDRCAQEEEDDE